MNKFVSKSSKSSVSKSSQARNPHDEIDEFAILMRALLPNRPRRYTKLSERGTKTSLIFQRSEDDHYLTLGLAAQIVVEQTTKQRNATHHLLSALLSADAFKGKRK